MNKQKDLLNGTNIHNTMYLNTLSWTAENVLAFLLNNLGMDFSIRELAKAVQQDYKIVFTTVRLLQKEKLVAVKRVSNINRCSPLLLRENASLFGFISERFAMKTLPKRIMLALQDICAGIASPFYVMLVFGSYAKGTARLSSDVDIFFIIENKSTVHDIEATVQKAATLNNLKINPVIMTQKEFLSGLKEESVAHETYKKHFIINGGEIFYTLISEVKRA